MAFSKNRRLADLVSSAGEVSSFVDASVTHADLHTSMDLTGKTVTVANASTGDSDTTAANTAFVQQEIAALVDSAPGTLNTLNELAAALGDDASFSTTVTNSIATKLPLAGGTVTGVTTFTGSDGVVVQTASDTFLQSKTTGSGSNYIEFKDSGGAAGNIRYNHSTNLLSVKTNGTDNRLVIDSSGKVGIGTSSPANNLHIHTDSGDEGLTIKSTGDTSNAIIIDANRGNAGAAINALTGKWNGTSVADILFLTGADTTNKDDGVITFRTSSADNIAERMRISSTGNVGIGVAPETTYSAYTSIEFGQQGAIIANDAADDFGLKVNTYLDSAGNWKRKETGVASSIDFDGDQWKFFTAASGSADSNISFAQKLRIDNDGIKFGSDTAAANALDDYEEGTWTPALYTYGGVTTTSSSMYGIYTKIGNICHIHCKISATLSSLPGQNWVITGLPFSGLSTSDANQRAIFAIGGDCINTGGNTSKAHFRIASNELHGVYFNASSNTAYWSYAHMDSSTFELNVHGFYTTS